MKRFLPLAILFFAVGLYFYTQYSATASKAPPKPKPIHFWCTALPAQLIAEFTREFERKNPQYKVELQTVAWNSLQEKTLWAVAAGSNVPDLILGSSEWMGGLANSGALSAWDDHLPPEFFQQYFAGALDSYKFPHILREKPGYRGEMRQYGVPFDLDMMLLYYRADVIDPVLEKLGMKTFPTNWEDFSRLGTAIYSPRTLRGHSQNLIYIDPEDPVPVRMAFLPASGGRLFTSGLDRAAFDEPEAIAAFSFMHQLIKNHTAKEWNRGTQSDPMLLVKSERILAYIAGPWYTKVLEKQIPEQAGKWRVAPFPTREPQFPCTGLGGSCLAMPYNAENKEGAVKLAQFLASDEFALAYFNHVGSPPPLRSAWNSTELDEPRPYFGGQKVYQVVRHAIDHGRPLQLLPNAQVMKQHVRWAMNEIITRDANATETLKLATQHAQQALE